MRFIPQIVVRTFYEAFRIRLEVVFRSFDDGIEMYLKTPLHLVLGWTTIERKMQQRSSLLRYLVKKPVAI